MEPKKYSDEQLSKAYSSLTDEQKIVLDEHVKRGKKTKWLNVWAKKMGETLTEEELENADLSMDKLLDWVLIDYEDSLKPNPNTKCECGRSLRYRYTVLQKSTGKIYKLGAVHFEQHTGLSPDIVRKITKGLKEIDLERDEILTKVIDKWQLSFEIPEGIEIPKDMTEQFRVKLPLLERQVSRLSKTIFDFKFPYLNQSQNKKSFPKSKPTTTYSPVAQNKEEMPPLDLSTINPTRLFAKLKTSNISSGEAWELYQFIKYRSSQLKSYGLYLDEIKSHASRVLGIIGNPSVRTWLVEIEDFYE